MRFVPSLRLGAVVLPLALASLIAACGDDGGDTGAETTLGTTTAAADTSTGEPDATGTSTAATTEGTTTGTLDESTGSTTAAATDDTTGGGPVGDPAYPPPVDGTCPQGTLPVTLPGAEICAPFCGGPDDACPAAATGNAMPQCLPFAGAGGSGAACDDVTPCPDGETCDGGQCAEIAFFACQLMCPAGETCPDDMACSGIGTCGYP